MAIGVAFRRCVNNFDAMGQVPNRQGIEIAKAVGAGLAAGGLIVLITAVASSGNRMGLGFGLGFVCGSVVALSTLGYLTYTYNGSKRLKDNASAAADKAAEIFNDGLDSLKKLG